MEREELIAEFYGGKREQFGSIPEMILNHYPQAALELQSPDLWPTLNEYGIDDISAMPEINIIDTTIKGWRPNPLELYADSVAASVQFPRNTAFLHCLGCFSAAASRHFSFKPYPGSDEIRPVNLYCVSGQPPSTGKSSVNNAFITPVRIAYKSVNDENRKKRNKLELTLDALKAELKSAKGQEQIAGIQQEIDSTLFEIHQLPDYVVDLGDSTPEGLESLVAKQNGFGNIISAEAEAVNVMLGSTYGDKSRKGNNGIFLSMWSGEYIAVQRAGRDGFKGHVRGSFAVLAQPESVKSILEAGKLGRGISERFLLISEQHKLGQRDHSKYVPVDSALKSDYIEAVNNIVKESEKVLEFDPRSHAEIAKYRNAVEAQMADAGQYNDNLLRGAMGKAGEQICKIACLLWIAQEWGRFGHRSNYIGLKTTQRAIEIFDQLSKTYLSAAELNGFAGVTPKVKVVGEHLVSVAVAAAKDKRQAKVNIRQLNSRFYKYKEFEGVGSVTEYLRDTIMPQLINSGYCVKHLNDYYLSPRLLQLKPVK